MSNTSRVTVTGTQIYLNVTGQFQQGNTYYMLADAGIVKDIWGFTSNAITNEDTIKFTMATSVEDTNSVLKEATNITTQRRYLQDTGAGLFNSQTTYLYDQSEWTFNLSNANAFTTSQFKFGNASYAGSTAGHLTAIPSTPSSITGDYTIEYWYKTPTTTDSGAIFDTRDASNTSSVTEINLSIEPFNEVNGVPGVWAAHKICNYNLGIYQINAEGWVHVAYVKRGTTLKGYKNGILKGTINDFTNPLDLRSTGIHLGANYLNGFPADGWIDDFKISSSAKYTENFTPPTSQAVADVEDYVFLVNCNLVNNLPYYYITKRINNKPIVITDLDIDSNLTYSITLTCNFGQVSYNGTSGYSLTLSGTKEEVNAKFNVIGFTPNAGVTTNGYVNYIQKRNGETRETGAFLLTCVGAPSAPAAPQGLYVYTSSGTFTLPADLLLPGVKADILIVGGGGGGAVGGGAGGKVIELLNQTLTNQTYSITVGTGGARISTSNYNGASGSNGTASIAFGQTAAGGQGGKSTSYTPIGISTNLAGGSVTPYAGGNGYMGQWTGADQDSIGIDGGGGAGSNGNGYSRSPFAPLAFNGGGLGATSTVYPGLFGAGGGGGHAYSEITTAYPYQYTLYRGTGYSYPDYGCGGAGGYYINTTNNMQVIDNYSVHYVQTPTGLVTLSSSEPAGDGYATAGKPGIVVIRFHT
jgi:hypothetical protein